MSRAALAAVALAVGCAAPARRPVAPPPEPAVDLAQPVAAIEVSGVAPARRAAVRQAIATAIGRPIEPVRLRADQRAILALGGFADVEVRARGVDGGLALEFRVAPRPVVRALEIHGSTIVGAPFDPAQVLAVAAGQTFDPVALGRGRRALLEHYRAIGFAFADVRWTARAVAGGVAVDVMVEERQPVGVRSVALRGNRGISTAVLLAAIGDRLEVGKAYRRDRAEDARVALTRAYYDRGYVLAQVGAVEETFAADDTQVDVVIPLIEGDRFRHGAVAARGALIAPAARYLELLGVARGAVFDRSRVTAGLARIAELHRAQGRADLAVDAETTLDEARRLVDLTLVVTAP